MRRYTSSAPPAASRMLRYARPRSGRAEEGAGTLFLVLGASFLVAGRAEDFAGVHGGAVGQAKGDQVAGDQFVLGVERENGETFLCELAHVGAHGVCAGGIADKGGRGFADLHGVYGQGQHGVFPFGVCVVFRGRPMGRPY